MAKVHILRLDEISPVDRGGGLSAKLLVSKAVGSTNLTNGVTAFPPRGASRLHTHNCDESLTLIEGEGVVEIDGEQFPMKPFDTAFVPAGTPHRFINKNDQPMRILWNYTSVNVTRTFADTGETVPHMTSGVEGG